MMFRDIKWLFLWFPRLCLLPWGMSSWNISCHHLESETLYRFLSPFVTLLDLSLNFLPLLNCLNLQFRHLEVVFPKVIYSKPWFPNL